MSFEEFVAASEGEVLVNYLKTWNITQPPSQAVETMRADSAKYGLYRLHELMRKTYRHLAENVGRRIKFVNISREERSAEVWRAFEMLTLRRQLLCVVRTFRGSSILEGQRRPREPP